MKRRRPFKSRLRNAFITAAGIFSFGTSGILIEQLPKNPTTDTQIITTFNEGTPDEHGYNISFIDQFWKQSLSLKGHDALRHDLIEAAQNGDSWRVRAVLEHGGINVQQDGGEALIAASRAEYNDVIAVLLNAGVPVNALNDGPFIAAMEQAHFDLAFRYMDMVAPSVENLNRGMVIGASYGRLDIVESFMARGVDIAGNNSAVLVAAASLGRTHIVSRLLQEKTTKTVYEEAPPAFAFNRGHLFGSPGFYGCKLFPDDPDSYAAGRGFDIDYLGEQPDYPPMPVPRGIEKTVTTYKVDLNASNGLPLKMAAINGQEATFRQLIDAGADIRVAPFDILSNAVRSENAQLVSYILTLPGVDASAHQSLALLEAVELNNHDAVRAFMKVKTPTTDQIMRRALEKGDEVMIDILKGNDPGPTFKMVPISIL